MLPRSACLWLPALLACGSGSGAGGATDGTASTWTSSSSPSTSSTSTSSTSSSTTGGGSSGTPFIKDPDGGAGSIECDIFAEDCPPGEKCSMQDTDEHPGPDVTRCIPVVPDPAGLNEPCTVSLGRLVTDDCGVHLQCSWIDPATKMGVCLGLCTGSEAEPGCEDPNAVCIICGDCFDLVCRPTCNPLTQDCPAAHTCVPHFAGFACMLDVSGDAGEAGDPCQKRNECDPGLFCANADSVAGCTGQSGCCSPYCDVADPNAGASCPGAALGETCVKWFEPGTGPAGLEDVGVCVIPG